MRSRNAITRDIRYVRDPVVLHTGLKQPRTVIDELVVVPWVRAVILAVDKPHGPRRINGSPCHEGASIIVTGNTEILIETRLELTLEANTFAPCVRLAIR